MLIVGSTLKGYAIEASDGQIGTVRTFLFDDTSWTIRWLAIDTGNWLSGRKVLLHPSSIGVPDHLRRHLPVRLSKAQVEASPDTLQDRPVTMRLQIDLLGHYGWEPLWGPDFFGPGGFAIGPGAGFNRGGGFPRAAAEHEAEMMGADDGDPHLRDMAELHGYRIHASDGVIGHLADFLVDDAAWAIRYLMVDTRNWWPGEHVLIAPYAVTRIDWGDRQIHLDVTCDQVRTSPKSDPDEVADRGYARQLHSHYDWPGYGW